MCSTGNLKTTDRSDRAKRLHHSRSVGVELVLSQRGQIVRTDCERHEPEQTVKGLLRLGADKPLAALVTGLLIVCLLGHRPKVGRFRRDTGSAVSPVPVSPGNHVQTNARVGSEVIIRCPRRPDGAGRATSRSSSPHLQPTAIVVQARLSNSTLSGAVSVGRERIVSSAASMPARLFIARKPPRRSRPAGRIVVYNTRLAPTQLAT